MAIAFGVRTAGGRFLFPPDIEERLDDRERRILARIERLRAGRRDRRRGRPGLGRAGRGGDEPRGGWTMPERGRPRLRPTRGAAAATVVGETGRDGGRRNARGRRAPQARRRPRGVLLPARDARGHKGSFGKLLVIAGSLDYAGAALLVCRAAGRAGVGLVTLAVPESLQPLFAAKVVEATTMALPEDDVEEIDPEPSLARILDHEHDAIVVGPGLRPGLATAELVRLLLVPPGDDPAPLVLDAEALRAAGLDRRAGGRATADRPS